MRCRKVRKRGGCKKSLKRSVDGRREREGLGGKSRKIRVSRRELQEELNSANILVKNGQEKGSGDRR